MKNNGSEHREIVKYTTVLQNQKFDHNKGQVVKAKVPIQLFTKVKSARFHMIYEIIKAKNHQFIKDRHPITPEGRITK